MIITNNTQNNIYKMKYTKETSRIPIKIIDTDTEETLLEIGDRHWMNVGEIFPQKVVTDLILNEMKNRTFPKNVMVIAIGEYKLEID